MKAYKKRIADAVLAQKLRSKGAVLVDGAKWCGKTTTSLQFSKSVLYMQDPSQSQQNLEMAELNPSRLLAGATPRLLDEWQMAPKLWDAVRFEVDQRDSFGQFILTGSAVPPDLSLISHSGIGRISRMTMRPMSLFESSDSNGNVSLADIFSGNLDIEGESSTDLSDLAYWLCRGGWPKALDLPQDIALQQAIDYFDVLVQSDISRVDGIERDPYLAARLLRSYARAAGTQAKMSSIGLDLEANENCALSRNTLVTYIRALRKIFVLEDSPAWNPNLRSQTAIRTTDTRYFTDPSVATAALGLGPDDLIQDLKTMGLFFENMAIRDLRVYADALGGQVYHYRDRNNLACDAVLHLRNGQYGLIEIKLGGDRQIAEAVKTLDSLAKAIDTSKMKAPAFKMVLLGKAPYAYCRKDGFLIVPLSCLRP